MGLLNRSGEKQTLRERGELRRHLDDLGDLREEKLQELGGIAVGMHRGSGFDREALWTAAAAIAAIDDEAKLVRRGLDEGLTLAQLEDLSRGGAGTETPAEGAAPAEGSPPAEAAIADASAEIAPEAEAGGGPADQGVADGDSADDGAADEADDDGPQAAAAGG